MCDTMVVMPGFSRDGSLLFAKNSDREPNEPHIIVKVRSREISAGGKTDCTYITVDNSGRERKLTNEALLFKPSWIWGAEMGVNEKGLIIGNEAVFTKEKLEDRALLGMDMLRLALEFCDGAREALDFIAGLTEKYGQGGKAGYTQNLRYHNSYIIADHEEAYVLETAGRHWVYAKVEDVRSISNALSIGSKYDGCSKGLVDNAASKGWLRAGEEFDFKKCYQSRLHLLFTKGDERKSASERFMRDSLGSLDVEAMKAILRCHCGRSDVEAFRAGSMESLCMHAGGGIITSQTTGSLVVRLKDRELDIWATGSSLPCISVFKPVWFSTADTAETGAEPEVFWHMVEAVHRRILDGSIYDTAGFIEKRSLLEKELLAMAGEAKSQEERQRVVQYAFSREKELLEELVSVGNNSSQQPKSGIYYKMYWKYQNRMLSGKR